MLTDADIRLIKQRIADSLRDHAQVSRARTRRLLPHNRKTLEGKLYEANVLAHMCERLHVEEGFRIRLVNGTHLMLKQKGGPINRNFPHFRVEDGMGVPQGEIWTDIYFTTLSHYLRGSPNPPSPPDYHELDIAFVEPGCGRYPTHEQIKIAVECKNTSIEKNIIREVLGFRRELSFYDSNANLTGFSRWPIPTVNSEPSSVHMFYCSDPAITEYAENCLNFGILLKHHEM